MHPKMSVKGYVSRYLILHNSNFRIPGLDLKESKKCAQVLGYNIIIKK